jgi:hypothetical protein
MGRPAAETELTGNQNMKNPAKSHPSEVIGAKLAALLALVKQMNPREQKLFKATQMLMEGLEHAAANLWDASWNSAARTAEKTLDDACKLIEEATK